MAKKSFILYIDSLAILEEMDNEQAGKLFKAIYVLQKGEQLEVESDTDPLIKIIIIPFKNQFIRDNEKWDDVVGDKIIAGRMGNLKRWHIDLYNQVIDNEIDIEQAECVAQGRKASHKVAPATTSSHKVAKHRTRSQKSLVNVNVSDIVNDNNKIYREFNHLSITTDQNTKLLTAGYTQSQIDTVYDAVENHKKNTNYTSLYLTSLNWLKSRHPAIVPKGEDCPYNETQMRLAKASLRQFGCVPEWFEQKWLHLVEVV